MNRLLLSALSTPQRWSVAKSLLIGACFKGLIQVVFTSHLPHDAPNYTREALVHATELISILLSLGIIISYVLHTLHLPGDTPASRLAKGLMWLLYMFTVVFIIGIHLLLPSGTIDNEPLF